MNRYITHSVLNNNKGKDFAIKGINTSKGILTNTRSGLALNPTSRYNYTGGTPDGSNVVSRHGDYIYCGGDTETYEYDFYTKVANSIADCPLKIYTQDISLASIPTATVQYTNMLTNGDFASTTGWTTIGSGFTWSVANNIATITNLSSSGSGFKLYQQKTATVGNKYYLCAEMQTNSSSDAIGFNGSVYSYHSGSGNYERLGLIYTATTTTVEGRVLNTIRTGDITANPVKIKNAIVIDLTATFGAGNEPTVAWCLANIGFSATTGTAINSNWSEITTQASLDLLKTQDSSTLGYSTTTSGKAKALMIELDISAIVTNLFGGSLGSTKGSMKKLNVDVYAYGSGSNSGVATNGCCSRYWSADVYNAWSGTIVTNSTGAVAKMTNLRGDGGTSGMSFTSTNKAYMLVYAQYASDGTIASTINLDYINFKLDMLRAIDSIPSLSVNLPKAYTMVLRGVGLMRDLDDNTSKQDKLIKWVGLRLHAAHDRRRDAHAATSTGARIRTASSGGQPRSTSSISAWRS